MITLNTHKVELYLRPEEEEILAEVALGYGFSRQHPKRKWTQAERKRAIIHLARRLVKDEVHNHISESNQP